MSPKGWERAFGLKIAFIEDLGAFLKEKPCAPWVGSELLLVWCLPWVIGRLAPRQGCAAVNQVGRKEAAVLGSQRGGCKLVVEELRLTARNPGCHRLGAPVCSVSKDGVGRVLWVLALLLQAAGCSQGGSCVGMKIQLAALGLFADFVCS